MGFKPNAAYYADGYKIGHKRMLAPGTTRLYGTWIPRSVKHASKGITKILSFGQQLTVRWLHDEWKEGFFDLPEEEALTFGKDMSMYLGLEYDAEHFRKLHQLGYLPFRVKSLPEGIETLPNVPHMTFINTVEGFAWLTLYLETIISSLSWKSSNSATIALQYKRRVTEWVMKTDPAQSFLIPFMCHDFSARGLSPFDMITSGLGHASSFVGSDTLMVIPASRYYYNEPKDKVAIASVNASEHSVSTTCIFTMGESKMIKYFMEQFPTGILSIVADTFDLFTLITKYLVENKEQIISRDGKLVIRPDSGNPVDIICGMNIKDSSNIPYITDLETAKEWMKEEIVERVRRETPHGEQGEYNPSEMFKYDGKYYKMTLSIDWNRYDKQYYYMDGESISEFEEMEALPQHKGVIELLWDIFGGTVNEQGYKVLDPHIGAIYGDSITLERQIAIYERLAAKGFASTNIVLGVGSYTYQYNTRDTLGFAAKGAWFEITDGDHKQGYDIYKDPITDDGTKKSLKGFVSVVEKDGNYEVLTQCTPEQEAEGLLQTIYENGQFFNQTSLTEIRTRIDSIV